MMGDLGKLIAAKGFQKLPKVQKIARSGHTGGRPVLVVKGGDSLSESCEFKSWHKILDRLFDINLF